MRYSYVIKQLSQDYELNEKEKDQVSKQFEDLMNYYGEQGWEFYCMDTVRIYHPPGCLAAFFGQLGTFSHQYLVVFRKPWE